MIWGMLAVNRPTIARFGGFARRSRVRLNFVVGSRLPLVESGNMP